MQNKTIAKRTAALLLALLMAVGIFAGCSKGGGNGEKRSVTVTVTHKDGSTKGAVLQKEGLIEGEDSQYGLFVKSVDGYTADEGSQEWWCLTVDGETAMTGIDSTPIEEGKSYGLVLTVGY